VTVLLVFLGGMIGAPARYALDRLVQGRIGGAFPWGTLAVNLLGSMILGALLGAGVPPGLRMLLGTGVCGAFTTFSTLGYETVRLLEDGSRLEAGLNAVGSLVLGGVVAAGSYALAAAVL
jgi:CrcB protein